jgi:NTP pyrophosphatase (non-canonical NTP hydrolase)
MSDPRYEHKFWPNKKGFCKQIVGDRHCGEEKDAIVHTRFEERKNAEEKELKDCSECAGIKERNIPEMLMLIVSELSEALEAHRKGIFAKSDMYDWCYEEEYFPEWFKSEVKDTFEDEIADTFIRLFDLCEYLNIDIEKHIEAKIEYNKTRGHKHGKGY